MYIHAYSTYVYVCIYVYVEREVHTLLDVQNLKTPLSARDFLFLGTKSSARRLGAHGEGTQQAQQGYV